MERLPGKHRTEGSDMSGLLILDKPQTKHRVRQCACPRQKH